MRACVRSCVRACVRGLSSENHIQSALSCRDWILQPQQSQQTRNLYLLCLVTVMVHVQVVVSSRDLKLTATQPYPRLSPSSKSCTRNRSRLFRVLLASITHDEYSLSVMHSFFIMFRYAVTVVFNNVYVFSDSKLISGLRAPPEHSTSCMLEMFLKLLTLIPASDPEKEKLLQPFRLGKRAILYL